MAACSIYLAASLLNWACKGAAAPTDPATVAVGLATSAPTSVSSFEIAGASGVTRQNPAFAAATTPAGTAATASNANAMTWGPFTGACTVIGIHTWDSSALTTGNMLLFGNLATARTLGVGDSLVVAAGALVATMV